jgi:hypothetical protein
MAHPLAAPGAIQSADRPLGRTVSVFFSPMTRTVLLIRTQRSAFPLLPCSSGMRQWESVRTTSASGKFASTCLPRGDAAAAGSAWISRTESIRRACGESRNSGPG